MVKSSGGDFGWGLKARLDWRIYYCISLQSVQHNLISVYYY